MELHGKVAVITGGASGIGLALARRFAAEGARGVAVADLDGPGAERAAAELDGQALGMGCDVADEAAVARLLDRVEDELGPVDVFCANAGIATGMGLDTPDEEWDRILAVNVRAHVVAARQLVPGWLERGGGYFLSTASAAGLLSQIGDLPYAVTKHAAVAFAEWLAITYGDRGIRVSCLCPQGVDTPLLRAGLGDAGEEGLGARIVAAAGRLLEPEEVAQVVVDALREERFLVLPHPEVADFLQRKASEPDRWLRGMRRLQAQVSGAR